MTKRILIMGLPGAGKTTLAEKLHDILNAKGNRVVWLNADRVRAEYNDWDFSLEGRIRQSKRMYQLSTVLDADFVLADFVAPLAEMRRIFNADITVWVDTVKESLYNDTDILFTKPSPCDFHITEQDAERWAKIIGDSL